MKWVGTSTGAIDLQINGGLGISFNDLTAENHDLIPNICELLWQHGIDAFLPTLITTSNDNLHRSMAYLSQYVGKSLPNSAKILGLHLEGPFLNPQKKGAHPLQHLQELNFTNVNDLLGNYASIVKLITLAPEVDTEGKSIAYLTKQGIMVSLGHSQADQIQTIQAIQQGAKMVTHTFNAMPSLHHRSANLLTEALLNEDLYVGAIADGVHVHPRMIELLYRLKRERLCLVSDALAPYGLGDGTYPWDQRQMSVTGGTAKLADGTLAGTTLPLWSQVQNLVKWGICSWSEAIATVTHNPAQLLALSLPPSLDWYCLEDGSYVYYRKP